MITPGTILIEKGTLMPQAFQFGSGVYHSSWTSVQCTLRASDLETELTAAGWTFFYMAGPSKATAFGFDKEKSVQAALQSLIAGAKVQNCNCLEIDEVAMHAFLGVPYVSVTAHSRHIQKGSLFSAK